MHPDHVAALTAAGIDAAVLANNHTLDYGEAGLRETLLTLHRAGIATAGAGLRLREAEAPAVLPLGGGGRVLLFALGHLHGGVPPNWGAQPDRPGIALLQDASPQSLHRVAARIDAARRPGDLVIVSLHWGRNWGYALDEGQRNFAHGLIDEAGVAIVYMHSSHHPLPSEVYKERLILYGCGDFVNDYEGIGGYEEYRGDLSLMYLPVIDPATGCLLQLRMLPFQIRRFRLHTAARADAAWLAETLSRHGRRFGTGVSLQPDGNLTLSWPEQPGSAGGDMIGSD
jgi:poly-gamma-glutamate synthesis protein (capsule biosynthesis protein)